MSQGIEYLIPFPYTFTIFSLLITGAIILISYRDKINWYKYRNSLFISFILGVAEIHNLENHGNVPSWEFPLGSASLGFAWGYVAWEDILFVPACFTIFYVFMWWIRRFKWISEDCLPAWTYPYLICGGLVSQAMIYQVAGKGIENLMIVYCFLPAAIFTVYCLVKRPKINVTHMVITFVFVSSFSMAWELFNVWRGHWVYNIDCDLMGEHGWFYGGKLHVGIFFQYAISGFVIVYGSSLFFEEKWSKIKDKRRRCYVI